MIRSHRRSESPAALQGFLGGDTVENLRAALPVDAGDLVVFGLEGMLLRHGVDGFAGLAFISLGGSDLGGFEGVRDLAEEVVDVLETRG